VMLCGRLSKAARPGTAASGCAVVLLRARALLRTLLKTAPAQRRPSISWRLERAEDLLVVNFPAIWRDANGQDPG